MRINIEWTAPWFYGYFPSWTLAFKPWALHWFVERDKHWEGQWTYFFRVLGFNFTITNNALWSGISLSINVWERKNGKPFSS